MGGGFWSDWRCLTAILSVALLLRLGCAYGVQRHLDLGSQEVCLIAGDAEGYWELARKIVAGENYELYTPPRRVMRMPGFPALLAAPRWVFSDNLLAARFWLAVIGTVGCGFVFLLGKELAGSSVGLWAAALTSLNPVLAIFSVLILSETSFAAALTASLFAIVKLNHRLQASPSKWEPGLSVLAGLLIAAATFLRPTWLLIGPISAGWLLLGKNFRRRLLAAVLILVGAYGALFPWGLRNQAVTGHFTFTTFWVGPSLYDGLNPQADGDSEMSFFDEENLLGRMTEFEMDQTYRQRAKQFASDHPGRAIQLMFIKLARTWTPWPNASQFQNPAVRILVGISFLSILIPALHGTWLARRRWELLLAAWGPILYFSAIHMVFVGSIRYRLPAEYPFAILAGLGLSAWRSFGDSCVSRPDAAMHIPSSSAEPIRS